MGKIKKLAIITASAALVLAAVPSMATASVAPKTCMLEMPQIACPVNSDSIQATVQSQVQASFEAKVASGAASAAQETAVPVNSAACPGYADANGDEICDYRNGVHGGAGYADADGDGICDNYALGYGSGNGVRDGSVPGNGIRPGACNPQGNGSGNGIGTQSAAQGNGHHGNGSGCRR